MLSCDNKTSDNGPLLMLGSPLSPLIGFPPDSFVYPACALHLPALSRSHMHSNFLAICLTLIRKWLCFALHPSPPPRGVLPLFRRIHLPPAPFFYEETDSRVFISSCVINVTVTPTRTSLVMQRLEPGVPDVLRSKPPRRTGLARAGKEG